MKTASHSKNVKEYQAVASNLEHEIELFQSRWTCSSFVNMGQFAFKINHYLWQKRALVFQNYLQWPNLYWKFAKESELNSFGGYCWCASGAKRGVAGWGLGSHDNATTAHTHTLKTTLMTLACCQRFSDTFSTTNAHRMQHTAELERGRAASQRWPIQFGTNSSRGNRTQSIRIPV